ncbi:MAG: flagellar motor protein MotA [Candidatus Syntrophoarchaeum caldarius]|uniref:Flagellar motor protein MotA n=1 Tax=Candidatus Syntropharchaeum caldarium TaxID=1838285 RepID=A0A1F2P8H5_9EURY|nr:MAG: flagellar motor protein MotA [Candidatus Syntrophoarchaeum caldarius]
MDISSGIMGLMFVISNSLLYPVVIALLILVAFSFVIVGQFISEYASRNRDFSRLKSGVKLAKENIELKNFKEASSVLRSSGSNFLLESFITDLTRSIDAANFSIEAEKLLQDYELRIARELEIPRLISRIAPMLGLMGTLIPMGPALMGLSSGNIEALASNLAIAFATTVLGILTGGIAYAVLIVKKRWYTQDLSDMEYVVEVLK